MAENLELVQKGFRILHPYFAGYVCQEMSHQYRTGWWQEVLTVLSDQTRDLPDSGSYAELVDSLDIANCIRLFDRCWNDVFRKKLSIDYRTWAKELMGVRNKTAHIGQADFPENDTWRALDTMSRLCDAFDNEAAEEIRSLLRQFRYGSEKGSTAVTNTASAPQQSKSNAAAVLKSSASGLPSWRDVIEPHPDVAQGRYKNAEFAADLAQVSRGEGSFEYRDPVEFFARTYVTEGMSGLLVQGFKRVSGRDGEPVIQLKTAFGGGKTHSMLALYHAMRGNVSVDKVPNLKPVLEAAGLSGLPKANVAVLVGTSLDPTKSKRPVNFPGITISTLWGEMAAQLAASAGDPSLYDFVKDADKKGVSPGSEALKNLMDACAPCLILMDELVAYAKKLYGVEGLPAGSFDNFITFIQEITEAARASKNSLVVASIPESDIEVGGEAGQIALEAIEHTFGRMESIWKPVAANEGFEVVRRRLFLDCKDPDSRDHVCREFSRMYHESTGDFPTEAKEVEYRERMISCYPIHPEIFDRLYEDWATLERFQRTRGVLRLMAAVIHELWMSNDGSPMIMPGSIALDVPNVRDELTRHLPEGWNAIVDREVDGKKSIPFQKDQEIARYGQKMACRRVARTIMLGSAPTSRAQSVRGIEASRIRLGLVQPGENVADFNDALNTLRGSLAYLYTNPSGDRFWYDTRPTLRKTVEDRATQIPAAEVSYEIEKRLRALKRENPFAGIHVCPNSSLDVPDDQTVRLVILKPDTCFKNGKDNNDAMDAVKSILDTRGTAPRLYRNMLAFLAPDQELLYSLQSEVRRYLAWLSVKNESEDLNLDAAQNRETEQNLQRSKETVDLRINETYCWLLTPYIDRAVDMKEVIWDVNRISGGTDTIVKKAASKMIQNEALITTWAPALLLMELDDVLWKDKDDISVKQLWDYLCTYCYLPRLANYGVLEEAILKGINSEEYFALAAGKSNDRYLDLKFNQYVGFLDKSNLLVKTDAAREQIDRELEEKRREEEEKRRREQQEQGGGSVYPQGGGSMPSMGEDGQGGDSGMPPITPPQPKNTRFYMSADLDNTRINRDVQRLVEEVINHLSSLDGTRVEVKLDVTVTAPNGVPQNTVRTVSENCKVLKIQDFGFEE